MSIIGPIEKDPSAYDVVIVVCPLWSGLMPPPMRTYIYENKAKLNRFALVSVSGSGEGNKKTIPDFEATAGKKLLASLLLKEGELRQADCGRKLQEFSDLVSKLMTS